jgi:hypothetical protein
MPEDWGGGETVQVDAAFKSFIFEGAPAELEDPNLRFRETEPSKIKCLVGRRARI